MNNQVGDVLGVLGGNREAQLAINLDADDVLKLTIGVAGGMLLALILFEGMKFLVKAI